MFLDHCLERPATGDCIVDVESEWGSADPVGGGSESAGVATAYDDLRAMIDKGSRHRQSEAARGACDQRNSTVERKEIGHRR
jgi:hypothetical protein